MIPASLKIYNVYASERGNALEDVVFIREGFVFWAFLFHTFWAVYQRIWGLAAMCACFYVCLILAVEFEVIFDPASFIVELGFLLWLGFSAADWQGNALKKRGYVLFDIVSATSEALAQQRFYDRHMPDRPVIVATSPIPVSTRI